MASAISIWRVLEGSEPSPRGSTAFPSNKRLYPRYLIPQDGLSFIELENGKRATIADISYGGISAKFEDDKFFRQVADSLYSQKPVAVKMEIYSKTIACNMVPVFRENDNLGLCFRHDSSEELVFLKNVISTLQIGVDLGNQAPHIAPLDFEYDSVGDSNLLGEIALETGVDDEPNARVVYRDGNIHYSVFVDRGHITTAQTIGMGGVLTPLTPTARLDKRILRGAAIVLAGSLSVAENPAIDSLYELLVRSLMGNRQRFEIAG